MALCCAHAKNVLQMRKRKGCFLAITVLLTLVLSHPIYAPSIIRTGDDYLTISALKQQAEFLYGQQVKVGGRVIPGLIDWNGKTNTMKFSLIDDEEQQLTMVYKGIAPNSFRLGADMVVEGVYHSDDTFEAVSFGSHGSFCNLCH